MPDLQPLPLPHGVGALPFGARRHVMGILNVTPDSFSDGGAFDAPERAIARAGVMLSQGADILDIGGESTRPGAAPVSPDEELARVLPVITGVLEAHPHAILSIDTTKAIVAREAIAAGAHIINDVSAMGADAGMLDVVAQSGAPIILMHMRGTPETMQQDTTYEDLWAELEGYFTRRIARAERAGITRDRLVLDPGIGFGKSVEQNYRLIRDLDRLKRFGCALLLGSSRKSFIGKLLDKPARERVLGTAASVACGIMCGADIVRVHDVAEMVDVVRVTEAIVEPSLARGL